MYRYEGASDRELRLFECEFVTEDDDASLP
jgi:hypothetical protein